MEKLIAIAREAGLANRGWSEWTASDAVQEAIETVDRLDTDALEKSFSEGRREYRLANWRVVWTTAPEDYDWSAWTETIETIAESWHGKTLRRVAIEPGNFASQTARYGSGIHPTWEEDPRVTEQRSKDRIECDRLEREAREEKRAAGLVWLQTATDAELEDFDTFESHGVRFDDVKTERKRREKEVAADKCAQDWNHCEAIIPYGATLIDDGEPSRRGTYSNIPGRSSHVYFNVKIVRSWPDDVDHANVVGDGNDNVGSVQLVADWITNGRLRIATSKDDVPPRPVLERIGHEKLKEIRRVETNGKTVWIGYALFGDRMVLDEKGHIVKSKKILAAVGVQSSAYVGDANEPENRNLRMATRACCSPPVRIEITRTRIRSCFATHAFAHLRRWRFAWLVLPVRLHAYGKRCSHVRNNRGRRSRNE